MLKDANPFKVAEGALTPRKLALCAYKCDGVDNGLKLGLNCMTFALHNLNTTEGRSKATGLTPPTDVPIQSCKSHASGT